MSKLESLRKAKNDLSYQVTYAQGQVKMYSHFLGNCHPSMNAVYENNLQGWKAHLADLEGKHKNAVSKFREADMAADMAKYGSH
jgi:hypothetical protein